MRIVFVGVCADIHDLHREPEVSNTAKRACGTDPFFASISSSVSSRNDSQAGAPYAVKREEIRFCRTWFRLKSATRHVQASVGGK